jgi:HD-like signal output (HDOD) protein
LSDSDKNQLQRWVKHFSKQDLPVFQYTARKVSAVTSREDSSAADLVQAILQDPNLTTRVLKTAKTRLYNPLGVQVSTVSQAVILLGFDTIRSICLSSTFVEEGKARQHRGKLVREMVMCVHAAFQARGFAKEAGDANVEEVFIAALLKRLGRFAFWCLAPEELSKKLERETAQPGVTQADSERAVLGFTLDELSGALCKEWALDDVLNSNYSGSREPQARQRFVVLGEELASAASNGWESPEAGKIVRHMARILQQPPVEVWERVKNNAREATRVFSDYGFEEANRFVPDVDEVAEKPSWTRKGAAEEVERRGGPEPNLDAQLHSLRLMSELVSEGRPGFDIILSTALEGLYRGVGLDRVLFAIMSPDRRFLRGRYALGWDRPTFVKHFQHELDTEAKDIFNFALTNRNAIWVRPESGTEIALLVTDDIRDRFGRAPFYIMRVAAEGKAVGVIYADRALSGRALDEESFAGFKHFCQQINLLLSVLARRGTKSS